MRFYFLLLSIISVVVIEAIALFWEPVLFAYIIVAPLVLVGIYDITQKRHTILRNFPVIGHFRFMFEKISPEIHQYFIESDLDGRPFNRQQRSIVYQRAKKVLDTLPYGTRKDVHHLGYEWLNHSLAAKKTTGKEPRIRIGGEQCHQPYMASLLNISAMSFGALSKNAILALNLGAKTGGFYHNTGEGGLSQYHLQNGGDVVWQLGTGYFGCRTNSGDFDAHLFQEKAAHTCVKMIEIKISQGAKPGHGGILPAAKVTPEIAEIRGVPLSEDVISPPCHSAFDSPKSLLNFITTLRELSGGKPIGFKLCVGRRSEFLSICKAMLEMGVYPDFITVDGAEGGTGAAPLEFSNAVGTPLNEGLSFVHNALVGCGLRDKLRLICSGKLTTGFEIVSKLAMGADLCNSARGMMMSLGCIQSLQCNNNHCPTGVTTQNPELVRGLVISEKYKRVANFHAGSVESVLELVAAAGLDSPADLRPYHIYRRISETKVQRLDEVYHYLEPGDLLKDPVPEHFAVHWHKANAERF